MKFWAVLLLGVLVGGALAAKDIEDEPTEEQMDEADDVLEALGKDEEKEVEAEEEDEEEDEEEGVLEKHPCFDKKCKRGEVCDLDEKLKPICVCAKKCPEPEDPALSVCSTANKTYASECHLFKQKCDLKSSEDGKRVRIHLDYYGPCKLIEECLEEELAEFPLRMRDWLKNVLVQRMSLELLTDKEMFHAKKIYEDERRLKKRADGGDWEAEILLRDFRKNYAHYVYPIHWMFSKLDQHPKDRYLTHAELAPLRAPLVPMEHCTTTFFKTCDDDGDKRISLYEWGACLELKEEDIKQYLID
ncbi:hypothetical protein Bbelb_015610 [Branchiostoma belcheri]|nr:hypothetical protein Bbelb_015610 [Branchiostoma belcheri]